MKKLFLIIGIFVCSLSFGQNGNIVISLDDNTSGFNSTDTTSPGGKILTVYQAATAGQSSIAYENITGAPDSTYGVTKSQLATEGDTAFVNGLNIYNSLNALKYFYPSDKWISSNAANSHDESLVVAFFGDSRMDHQRSAMNNINADYFGSNGFSTSFNDESTNSDIQWRINGLNSDYYRSLESTQNMWGINGKTYCFTDASNISVYLNSATEGVNNAVKCTDAKLFYLKSSWGATFKYRVNSGDWVNVDASNATDTLGILTIPNSDTVTTNNFRIDFDIDSGDSVYFYRISFTNRYMKKGINVHNLGTSQSWTYQYLTKMAYLKQYIDEINPDQIHIYFGTNDLSAGYTTAQIKTHLHQFIDTLKTVCKSSCEYILYTDWDYGTSGHLDQEDEERAVYFDDLRTKRFEIAHEDTVSVFDVRKVFPSRKVGNDMGLWLDVVHLSNPEGREFFAQKIMDIIQPEYMINADITNRKVYRTHPMYFLQDSSGIRFFKYDGTSEEELPIKIFADDDTTLKVAIDDSSFTIHKNTISGAIWDGDIPYTALTDVPATSYADVTNKPTYNWQGARNTGGVTNSPYYQVADCPEWDLSTEDFSVLIHFKPNQVLTNYSACLFSKWGSAGNRSFRLMVDTAAITFYASKDGTNAYSVRWPSVVTSVQDYFLVLTRTGLTYNLYVNGTLDSEETIGTVDTIINSATDVYFMCNNAAATNVFRGDLYDIMILNKEITSTEVTNTYNAGKIDFGYLQNLYRGGANHNIINWTFSTSTTYFSAYAGAVTANNDALKGEDNVLMYIGNSSNSAHRIYLYPKNQDIYSNIRYKMSLTYYMPTLNDNADQLRFPTLTSATGTTLTQTTMGEWVTFTDTVYFMQNGYANGLLLSLYDGSSESFVGTGDTLLLTSFTMQPIGITAEYLGSDANEFGWFDNSLSRNHAKGVNNPEIVPELKRKGVSCSGKSTAAISNYDVYIPHGAVVTRIDVTNYDPSTNITSFTGTTGNGEAILTSSTITAARNNPFLITVRQQPRSDNVYNYVRFQGTGTPQYSIVIYWELCY